MKTVLTCRGANISHGSPLLTLVLALCAARAVAHPQPHPQSDVGELTNTASGLLSRLIRVHHHQQRDPRLLPYHDRPRPEDEDVSSVLLVDAVDTAQIVEHDIAAPSSRISSDDAQPTVQDEPLSTLQPQLITMTAVASSSSPALDSAAMTISTAVPESAESGDAQPGTGVYGTRLLRPLRVLWDDKVDGEVVEDGSRQTPAITPGQDADAEPGSGESSGNADDTTTEDDNEDGTVDEYSADTENAGHGHWPDYDATATSADDNEADPGEGGTGLSEGEGVMMKPKLKLKLKLKRQSKTASGQDTHGHTHGKRSSHALLPKGKTHPHPHPHPHPAPESDTITDADNETEKPILFLGNDLFDIAVGYPPTSPASSSSSSSSSWSKVKAGEISDWLKLQREFALQQRWRRCTRFGEGVCPEKP